MTSRLAHSILILALLTSLAAFAADQTLMAQVDALKVTTLRTEYKDNPLGIDARKPRFSWQIQRSGRGVVQAAYQLRVAADQGSLQKPGGPIWDSGRVDSGESIHRVYEGPALESGKR